MQKKSNQLLKNKLVIFICVIILLVSAIILIARDNYSANVFDSLEINMDSELVDYLEDKDGVIKYSISQDGDNRIDFENTDDKLLSGVLGHLRFGAYKIRVEYSAEYDTTSENKPITQIAVTSKKKTDCKSDKIKLYDYKSWQEQLVWVTSFSGASDVQLEIDFSGYGDIEISAIDIYEYQPWKMGFMLAELLLLALVIIWYYVIRKMSVCGQLYLLGAIGLVIFASFPALYDFTTSVRGHDYYFHVARIASIANEISYGHFPALYQSDASNGYGYNSLCMYGNIFLYIPAVMHLLGYPLAFCYNFYIVLTNIVTCAICWYCIKRMFNENRYAFLGCAIYMLAATRLNNLYIRSSLGEYTAMAFMPLVIYGFYKVYTNKRKTTYRDTLPLILGISGIIESHVLSIVLIAGFVILFVIIHVKTTIKNIVPLLEALLSVVAVNAFFIIPFLQGYSQELQVNSQEYSSNISDSALYFSQIFNLFMTTSGKNIKNGMNEELPLTIGFSLVIGIGMFIAVCICRKSMLNSVSDNRSKQFHNLATECFCYILLALWMSSIYFPWTELAQEDNQFCKIMTSIQFPWRYLTVATVFGVVLSVYAVKQSKHLLILDTLGGYAGNKNFEKSIISIYVIITICVAGSFFTGLMDESEKYSILSNTGSTHADALYLPYGMEDYRYDTSIHCEPQGAACVERGEITDSGGKIFDIKETTETCTVTFPVTYYDYMVARDVQTGTELQITKGYNEQLAVVLQKGYTGRIVITYSVPMLWKFAYVFSFVCIIVLCACEVKWLIGDKKRRYRRRIEN